ncbi:MAG: tetratricopeptide repeat protein [Hungatella sp.]|jgi:tetratricopeptide (TPR) repeat protein|nr:tetratricopeptide repeat protein [Hungatella sp.]
MRRKTGYGAAILGLALAVAIAAGGCGKKENKYSYRAAGIEALDQGNYDSAVEAFDQAINSSKGLVGKFDVDVLKYRAEAEYLAGDYSSAADTYGILIKIDRERPEYLNLRSVSRAGAGDLNGAIEDYKRSAELDTEKKAPGRLKALLAAGAAMEKAGTASDAMSLYEEAINGGEESAQLYNRMGLCKMAGEDWDGAAEYFNKGLSAADSSEVPELLFNQAVAKERKGEFKTALDLMQQYVSAHGPDEEAEREITFLKTR